MLPLTLAEAGEESIILKVCGSPDVKKHLGDMGFVAGATVKLISASAGDLIVNIKEVRVAISRELAQKIMI